MNLADALRSSFGELLLNKLRTVLTMLGVIIGVGTIVLLASLGQGLQSFIMTKLMAFGTNLVFVSPGKAETAGMGAPPGTQTENKLTVEDAEWLRDRLPDAEGVSGNIMGLVEASYQGDQRDCMVLGVGQDYATVYDYDMALGKFFTEGQVRNRRRVCIIGWTVRKELFRSQNPLGAMIRLGEGRFRVIGVIGRKGNMFGMDVDDVIYLPNTTATRFFGRDQLMEIAIKVRQGASVDQTLERARRLMIFRHDGEEDFTVLTFESFLEIFNSILGAITAVLVVLAWISLVVGGIGIMNIMLVAVRERTREIGIRKAIGATRLDVMAQFLIEAVVISLLGGVIGAAGAVAILAAIPLIFPSFPTLLSINALLLGFGFAVGVGVIFGVYPAWKAAGLQVVDALRYG